MALFAGLVSGIQAADGVLGTKKPLAAQRFTERGDALQSMLKYLPQE
jgi:hypothetical protein